MKSKFIVTLLVSIFSFQSAFGAWTYVPDVTKKREQASEKALKLTKNVRVDKLLDAVEPFFALADYEALQKSLKDPKAKRVKLDSITHTKDSFQIKSGDLKISYKWVNKDNVAFTLNGTPFSYEEASKTELWQPKVHQVVKAAVGTTAQVSLFPKTASHFGAFGLLDVLFHTEEADAFLTNPWVLGAIGVAAVGLIGLSFYNKHKEEHQQKLGNVQQALATAKQRLEDRRAAALAEGNENPDLSSYQAEVDRLANLAAEYGTATEDLGFFGYLFGKRIKTPGNYFRENFGVQ